MKGYRRRKPGRGDDAWELVAEEGRDPVTGRRKRVSRLFRGTSREADTALAQLVADVTRKRIGSGTDTTLTDLLDRWLELVGDDLSPTTLHGYRQVIRSQVVPAIGARPISKITTSELDLFYRSLLATRSATTVRQTHAILHRAFRQATRWGWLDRNPATDATPPVVRKTQRKIPDVDQVKALIAAATEQDAWFGCLLFVASTTGARRGEVCGLQASQLDLEHGALVIDRAVVDVAGHIMKKGTKTDRGRVVALDPKVVAALRAQRDRVNRLTLELGVPRPPDPFVFPGDEVGHRPARPDVVTKRFARLAAVHAPGARLHDLRHFSATALLGAGVPVKTVSARLGHSSAAMTLDVYGHALDEADRSAAEVIGRMLG